MMGRGEGSLTSGRRARAALGVGARISAARSFLAGAGAVLLAGCGAPALDHGPVAASTTTPASSAIPSAGPTLDATAALARICHGDLSAPLTVIGSRHFVDVGVTGPKGSETLRFHVDTGGNTRGLLLSHAAAQRLGATDAEDLSRDITFGGRPLHLPDGADWAVADEAFDDFDHATRKSLASGQIGAGFLSRFVVCIDPSEGRLGLGRFGAVTIQDAAHPSLPVMMQMGGRNKAKYPFVLALVYDGTKVVGGYGMLLDTGATTSMLETPNMDYLLRASSHTAVATGAAGDADMIGARKPERMLRVGHVMLSAPKAVYPDAVSIEAGPATFVERPGGTWKQMFGFLGPTNGAYGAVANDLLGHFRVLIDYEHDRAWLLPFARPTAASAALDRIGISVRFGDDGCPTIVSITDTNDPTTRSTLQVGDVVKRVDAVDACRARHDELQAALAGPPGTRKKLTLGRPSGDVTVDLATARILPEHP
jgi:hypothetical protein